MTMSLSAVCAIPKRRLFQRRTAGDRRFDNPGSAESDYRRLAGAGCGDWYNTKGDLVLTVEGAAINGSAVADIRATPTAILGKSFIREQAGDRVMSLDLMGHKSHQYISWTTRLPCGDLSMVITTNPLAAFTGDDPIRQNCLRTG